MRHIPVFLLIFLLLIPPAYYGYKKTNKEVYYDMGQCLPRDIQYVAANEKLSETFNVASTHMLLVDPSLPPSEVRQMAKDMEKVPGVFGFLGSYDEKSGCIYSNHNDRYDVVEDALKRGAAMHAQFAADYLAAQAPRE